MAYVTRGTVQVELQTEETGTERAKTAIASFFISPTQGFSLKLDKEDYIVFVPEDASTKNASTKTVFEARIFKKTQGFRTNNPVFITQLTQAAFNKTNIEIKIQQPTDNQPLENKPVEIDIVSVKIPATP